MEDHLETRGTSRKEDQREEAAYGAMQEWRLRLNKGDADVRVWGSDVIAAAIREQNFPYIVLNPGASFRGLHDSLVNYLGNEHPKMLVVLHEEHALGIAQGYATVTDRPLAVIVHANVGLMHATMGIFDAWCARQPVVIFGANGPIDAIRRRPWIDWIHTTADQASMIRHYIKWDDTPGSAAAAVESVRRATLLACTRPCGPVYVNLDVTVQESELDGWPELPPASSYHLPRPPAPPEDDLEMAAGWLNDAKDVVILAGRMSRDETAWNERIALAEKLGARVLSAATPGAFPTTHPCSMDERVKPLGPELAESLRKADVILALEYVDSGGTLSQIFPPGAPRTTKIINCSIDYQLHNGWIKDHHVLPICDLHIGVTPEQLTRALLPRLKDKPDILKGRRSAFSVPPMPTGKGEIGVRDLAATFLNVTRDMQIALMGRIIGWPANSTSIDHPHDWLGEAHGGGLGCGPSIAIGMALALRDIASPRIPVAICGDGDFAMGASAIWTAANEKVPMLLIIANNRSFFNDELHQQNVARRRDRPEERAWIGQRIDDPPPDMATIARGFGVDGAGPIEKLEDLADALRVALAAVKSGKTYVLDVVTRREYA